MNALFDTLYEQCVGRSILPFYEGGLRGRKTFVYHEEFERQQWLPPEEIRSIQWDRVRALMRHAYGTVEYYREVFDRVGMRPEDVRTPDDFARLPILDKPTVRANRDRLLSSRFRRDQLTASATGGSTGEPLQFYYDRNSYERRTAAAMRGDSWAGWRLCAPEFYIWGVPLLPQRGLNRLKRQLHHASLRRTIVNSFDLNAERIDASVRKFNAVRPRIVVGYANAVYGFAKYVDEAGLRIASPRGVITSAERLFDHQRETIERIFGSEVYNRYGCREVMMIAAECERHAGLHVTADNLYVEVTRNGEPCGPGETGEVLLTDLHNYGMPLIRYRVGDLGSWSDGACPCGRGLPLLNVVEGRTLDLISTPSGRVLPGVFFPHLLKDFRWIRSYQVVQERREELQVRIAVEGLVSASEERLLRQTVCEAVGPEVRVQWEVGEHVVIERTNKFRPVISYVPLDLLADRRGAESPCDLQPSGSGPRERLAS